jgi:hypothetical protein
MNITMFHRLPLGIYHAFLMVTHPENRHVVSVQGSKTCDIRTTRRARSSFPKRSKRRKVGEMGSAWAKSSNQLLQTTRKSTLKKRCLEWRVGIVSGFVTLRD